MLMLFCLLYFEYYLPISYNPFRLYEAQNWDGGNSQSNIVLFSSSNIWKEKENKNTNHSQKHISNHQLSRVCASLDCMDYIWGKNRESNKKKTKTILSTWHEHTFVCRVFVFVFVVFVFMHVYRNLVKAKSNRIFDNASFGLFDFFLFALQFNVLHFVSFFVLLISKCSSDPIRRRQRQWRKRHRCVWLVRNWIQM